MLEQEPETQRILKEEEDDLKFLQCVIYHRKLLQENTLHESYNHKECPLDDPNGTNSSLETHWMYQYRLNTSNELYRSHLQIIFYTNLIRYYIFAIIPIILLILGIASNVFFLIFNKKLATNKIANDETCQHSDRNFKFSSTDNAHNVLINLYCGSSLIFLLAVLTEIFIFHLSKLEVSALAELICPLWVWVYSLVMETPPWILVLYHYIIGIQSWNLLIISRYYINY